MLGLTLGEEFRGKRLKGAAIEANCQMKDVMLVLDIRSPLVEHALRRWAVGCTPKPALDPRSHHLYLNSPKTLYGVESASLAPGYSNIDKHSNQQNFL